MAVLLKSCNCPLCDSILDAATGVDNEVQVPVPGDHTVCIYCASPLQFDDDMNLVHFPVDQIDEPEVRAVIMQIIEYYQQFRTLH
jgi:hypothetical protein